MSSTSSQAPSDLRRFCPELVGLTPGGDLWPLYFDAAWGLRGDVFELMIAQGETSLPRLLARFYAFERDHKVQAEITDGRLTGTLYYQASGPTDPLVALDALETWHRGVIHGREAELLPLIQLDFTPMLVRLAQDVDTIIDLGAGYGRHIFGLYHGGAPAAARYVGAEISESGRALAARLAALEPGLRFESAAFDLRRPDWSLLRDSRKALIYSNWSLMYPENLPEDFFDGLAAWPGQATLVFAEPLGFQWGNGCDLTPAQRLAFHDGGLNRNFAAVLDRATARGLLEPLVVARDIFASGYNPNDLVSVVACFKG